MPAADAALAVAYSPALQQQYHSDENVILEGMEMQIRSNKYDSFLYWINFVLMFEFSHSNLLKY